MQTKSYPVSSSATGSTLSQPSKHPDLWFTDGSIVLRAEDTLFRVHKSQLARHSVFFRDLFSLTQPSVDLASSSPAGENRNRDTTDEIEGCIVVRLYDAAEDVANILAAIYDGPKFGNNDPTDFRIVSGILRLATKYLVDSLRAKALAHLSIAWPNTIKGWNAREDLVMRSALGMSNIYPSPVDVINLAREVNAPNLLPCAFYDLSRHHNTQEQDDEKNVPLIARLPLSTADLQRLESGKAASQGAVKGLILSMGLDSHPLRQSLLNPHSRLGGQHRLGSPSLRACKREFFELVVIATQHYLVDRRRGYNDPLYAAEELGEQLYGLGHQSWGDEELWNGESICDAELHACDACAKVMESWAMKEKERMWRMIPLWFRLDL